MLVSSESKEIMQTHYNVIGGDLNKSWSNRMKSVMLDSMQEAQVELINLHLKTMNEVDTVRALKTLKQIQKVAL